MERYSTWLRHGSQVSILSKVSQVVLVIKWKWKFLSCVWLFVTPCNSLGQNLDWVAFPFSRRSFKPRSPHCRQILYQLSQKGKSKNTGVGRLSLPQQIFPTQETNLGLLHCSPANIGDIRDLRLIPGSRRLPGWRHGNSLQYSCLENPVDKGAWKAIVLFFFFGRIRTNNTEICMLLLLLLFSF